MLITNEREQRLYPAARWADTAQPRRRGGSGRAVISATASAPGRTYRIAVRGLRCRVLAMISCSGMPCSPRWVAAEWRSWCNSHPVYRVNRTRAVVAEPGPSGGGAQIPGCGAAGGAGAAPGQEHRSCVAAADEAREQVRGAGAPADPFGVAARGPARGAAGVQVEVFDVQRQDFAGAG